MKSKLTAFILALAVASWAQTAAPNAPSPAPQDNAAPQAKASCCHKTADAKEGESCPRHKMAGMDEKAKEEKAKDEKAMSCCAGEKAAACCSGKDAKSCMKGDKDKAASCGDCCAKGDEKGCCASHKEGDKTAKNCCSEKKGFEHCASPRASLDWHVFASAGK
jgi:hypothetical protein